VKRLVFIKCDNGFKNVRYVNIGKHGGMTKKADRDLKCELSLNGTYEALEIVYIDTLPVSDIESIIYNKNPF